jgi:hypothetical protein
MAYALGFFAADGSLDINARGGYYFSFHCADKDIIYKIRSSLGSDHKITRRVDKRTSGTLYRMQIGSKEVCGDLLSLGMSQRKTDSMCLPNVPDKYIGDFIRGYFDGDGNVWVGEIHKERKRAMQHILTAFTSCSEQFLKELWDALKANGVRGGSLFGKQNAYRLQFAKRDSLLLANIMYDNLKSNLFLERKRKVFEKFKMRS